MINKFFNEKAEYKECIVLVRKNDLTKERTDVIVNPANEELGHGGGAAKAIKDKGGKVILRECENYIKENKKLPTGMAIVTNAGGLNCGYVIHAVGPIYDENDQKTAKKKMIEVIQNICQLMIERDFKSVSIPGISTGIYNFPLNKAAKLICKTIKTFIDEHKSEMKERQIIFCNFDDKTTDAFAKYVQKIFSENEDLNPEPDDYSPKPPRCSNCNHKIKDISHQRKGKHLDICLKCYEELKREKVCQLDKSDESGEVVNKRRINLKNKMRSNSPKYKENSLRKNKNRNRDQPDYCDNDKYKSEKKKKKDRDYNESD